MDFSGQFSAKLGFLYELNKSLLEKFPMFGRRLSLHPSIFPSIGNGGDEAPPSRVLIRNTIRKNLFSWKFFFYKPLSGRN
jgi:hypothetical protein